MPTVTHSPLSIAISSSAHQLNGTPDDYDSLMDLIGDARATEDETHAVEPLEPTSRWKTGEAPETFPVGV